MDKKLSSTSRAVLVALITALSLCVCAVNVQAQSPGGSPLSHAIEQVSQGDFDDGALGIIVQSHGVEAVPALKKQFELAAANDWPLDQRKDDIAEVLVELHAEGDAYWEYLAARAKFVLDCDAPVPLVYDAQGKMAPGKVSPQFIDWAKEHHLASDTMEGLIVSGFPERMLRLASTRDARAVPILRSALSSRYDLVEVAAAAGLVKLHDDASIPLIIVACNRARPDTRVAIAIRALIHSKDPSAQQAAAAFLPAEVLRIMKASDAPAEPF